MAAMLVKNALQLGLRSRPSHLGMRTMSIISTNNFSATSSSVVPFSMLMMSTPMNHMRSLDLNHVVINTGIRRQEIGDYLPQVGELFECPTTSLIEPLQAIKRTYQPSVLRRKRKHGFRTRRVSISGRKVLKRRFNKGRWRMSL